MEKITLGEAYEIATRETVNPGDSIVSNVTGRTSTFIAIYWDSNGNHVKVQHKDFQGVVRIAYAKNFGLRIRDFH